MLEPHREDFLQIARLAREGDIGEANARFNRLLEMFTNLLARIINQAELTQQWTAFLQALFQAQQDQDWILFADLLEYQSPPL